MSEQAKPNEDVARLVEVLERLGYVTVVKVEETKAQVRLLCRVIDKKAWISVLERILQNVTNWQPHICQQYFLKDGALVFGWNFIIASQNPAATCKAICSELAAPEPVEVDTFPLRGALRPPAGGVFNPKAPGPSMGGPTHKGVFPVGGKG